MKNEDRSFFIAVRDFLAVYLPKQRCASANTIKSYRDTLNLFIDFLTHEKQMPLDGITFAEYTYQNVMDFLDWLQSSRRCGSSTRNQRLFALKSLVKYAGTRYPEWISLRFELDKVPVQKTENNLIEFIPEDALRAILEQPDPGTKCGMRDLNFMVLMYDTAARDREILDLTVGSLHLNQKYPSVHITGKAGRARIVPIMDKTVEHLRKYLSVFHPAENRRKEDYLFYTVSHGQKHQMSDDNVAKFMAKYANMARTKCISVPERVHPHLFRHARAIHLYRGGMPLPLLSEFMGHASVQTTTIYAYADTEMKRLAIEKVADKSTIPQVENDLPAWQNDEELIKRLYGLK
ncbi:site-specific integrase [Alicyclobacillus tolerans]|uniref:tyrosine-type recombinase/integrase n=1 Tax=Alicyclobacillus tolerans TaxID=90970 RepID=UPI001F28B3C3|nr:tyrosine-type recombinase/integrase [Alicyclobacillus tolerans]MCF8568530.1 site-specific integrase [Alicyclobacillus tolerans]